MGLMFMFPVKENESDRINIEGSTISLKSYGLPMVFWGYLSAILVAIFAMFLAIVGPMQKLYATDDTVNKILVIIVAITIFIIPFASICFFFYEKFIEKNGKKLTITHRVFWIPFLRKTHELLETDSIFIKHHMDSPNVAKMKNDPNLKGFENKGYFELYASAKDGSEFFVDRCSRKADLIKIKDLLSK